MMRIITRQPPFRKPPLPSGAGALTGPGTRRRFLDFRPIPTYVGTSAPPLVRESRWALTVVALLLLSGCVQPQLRGALTPVDAARFRADAVRFLQESALGDEPALRMNAIEALADVAPVEGLQSIEMNLENEYAGASFAAMMALGTLREKEFLDRIRTRSEHPDPNVRIAALYALHRMGDQKRTGELGNYLLNHRDAHVRANAALAIGRLGEPSSTRLLNRALKRERKDLPRLQILEALAIMGDRYATEQLIFLGRSAYPDQATLAIGFLANAKSPDADELFRDRLSPSKTFPEIGLAAARGLGVLGDEGGLDLALCYLAFEARGLAAGGEPPEQQTARVRGLAALALEAIGNPEALKALHTAFRLPGQSAYVRLAVARAAIRIIDGGGRRPSAGPRPAARSTPTSGKSEPASEGRPVSMAGPRGSHGPRPRAPGSGFRASPGCVVGVWTC